MTIIACARRNSDGLLTWAQVSPQAPDPDAIIQNGVNAFGGVASDWDYTELSETQYQSVLAAMPGRSFLALSTDPETGEVSAELSSLPAPAISLDKSEIEDDGVDKAAITFDVGGLDFSGDVSFIITAPDGEQQTIIQAAVAGVATLTLTTLLTGSIVIDTRAESHGDGIITLEGI